MLIIIILMILIIKMIIKTMIIIILSFYEILKYIFKYTIIKNNISSKIIIFL